MSRKVDLLIEALIRTYHLCDHQLADPLSGRCYEDCAPCLAFEALTNYGVVLCDNCCNTGTVRDVDAGKEVFVNCPDCNPEPEVCPECNGTGLVDEQSAGYGGFILVTCWR